MDQSNATGDGYTAIATGWDPDHSQLYSRLLRNGEVMDITTKYLVPRARAGKSRNTGRLGIPQGRKQVGVNVAVVRGVEKEVQGGFMLKLREGSQQGEKYGVFIREGGKKKHLYGPSVYQLFRWQAPRLANDTADDLEQTLIARVGDQMKDLLK